MLAASAAVALLGLVGCTATAPLASPAAAGDGVTAESTNPNGPAVPSATASGTIAPEDGGTVTAAGVSLTVPPGAVTDEASATITPTSPGVYDVAIDREWTGEVDVSMPLSGPDDFIVHRIDGLWTPAGPPGLASVPASSLSPWSTFTKLPGKLAEKACLTYRATKFFRCLAGKGVKFVSKKAAEQVAKATGDSCASQLIADAVGGPSSIATSMFTDACEGSVGDPPRSSWPTSSGGPPGVVTGSTQDAAGAEALQPTTGAESDPGSGSSGATTSSHPTFSVMNTSETLPDGVWFRRSPHSADTSRTTGLGVFRGEQVALECYGRGESVGSYGNPLWYRVENVTRPTNRGITNAGWLNAHYIDDGRSSNVVVPGVAAC